MPVLNSHPDMFYLACVHVDNVQMEMLLKASWL